MAARARRKPVPEPQPVALPPAPPAFGAHTIEDLRLFRCRFICSADGQPTRYCGRPTTPSPGNRHGSCCDEHLAVVFTPWRRGGHVVFKAKGR